MIEVDGAESFPALYSRAQKFLEALQTRHPNDIILIVTHGDIGKMIRAAYYELSWKEGLQTPYFDNTDILELTKIGKSKS